MSIEALTGDKKEQCGFRHGMMVRPPAEFVLYFARPCGCVTMQVSRPSLACGEHARRWQGAPDAVSETVCSRCGVRSKVRMVRVEKIG